MLFFAIGHLALETLLSRNALLRKSDVVREVGQDVFDYGLLIGHEDAYRLIRDETADIFVTFPHRSIQEFLGALYFVWLLDQGYSLKSILGPVDDDAVIPNRTILTENPLFLKFCLWFCTDQEYLVFIHKDYVYRCLTKRCLRCINSHLLVLMDI